jgi:acetyl-CoA carboxylase carboxyl transferase subunit alpha
MLRQPCGFTGRDLLELGVVDEVLEEPSGGNNWAPLEAGEILRAAIERHLDELLSLSEQQLREARYSKFRAMGRFLEKTSQDVRKRLKVSWFANDFCQRL